MHFKTSPPPYMHQPRTVSWVMHQVLYALIPGISIYVWCFGWGIVINIILASITALTCEAWLLKLRQKPLGAFLKDNSALVTAWLFALALPPFLPWWMTVLGSAFAIIFAKQLYGGLGFNPFNPAMVGYVMLLISFPVEMTQWPQPSSLNTYYPSVLDSLSLILSESTLNGPPLDAITGATPLDTIKVGLKQFHTISEIQQQPLFRDRSWQWVNGAYLLGGIWLIYRGVISWQIPVALLSGLCLIALVFFFWDSDMNPSPIVHIFSGATLLGAFFIATDPVTAATSNRGRLIYGFGIGILVYIIRTWGGYPDGVAFAVLLMNMAVPMIDNYTQPRVFGQC